MRRQTRNILIGVAAVFAVSFMILRLMDIYQNPGRVAYILNIAEPPKSMRVIECESGPITDVVITCAIEIDPHEFSLLLDGYHYSRSPAAATSYTVGIERVGSEFPVSDEYVVRPSSFKDGGSVSIFADKEKRRAVVDLYIE